MSDEGQARSFWRQPLLHFLVAGAAIFALDALREPADSGGQRIVVTTAHVERLADQWQMTWGRPPGETELQTLVQNYIKEEVYYREAIKLGLDVNDSVIRQRLGQKMEFLFVPERAADDASESELVEYHKRHRERYRKSPEFGFEQLYFTIENASRLAAALEQLQAGGAVPLGDSIGLPMDLNAADKAAITRTFGSQFYTEILLLEPDVWSGPVTSGFGLHLVKITERTDARYTELSEVRDAVVNDWLSEQNADLQESAYKKLRETYEVDIRLGAQ